MDQIEPPLRQSPAPAPSWGREMSLGSLSWAWTLEEAGHGCHCCPFLDSPVGGAHALLSIICARQVGC